jgi:TRAP transporter TAXI family solute receptor
MYPDKHITSEEVTNLRIPKALILVVLLAFAASTLFGCGGGGGGTAEQPKDQFISIATGGVAGTYYPLGGAMAEIFNANVPGVNATAETTNASVANVRLLEGNETEFAFIQNDISYYALNGMEMFADGKVDILTGIATLYPEVVQVVTLKDKGINSIEDLRGKKVAVGAPSSGTEANARQILAAYGMTFNDIKPDFLSFGEAASNMKDGHVDAAFLTAGLPTAAVTDLGATHNIKIIPLTAEAVATLGAEYPFYASFTIDGGTYAKEQDAVLTVAVKAMLVASGSLSEDMVYNLTKALFENLDKLAAAHQRGGDVGLDSANEAMSLPLHPGAEKYFKEQGVL